jgi:hypothetical protein
MMSLLQYFSFKNKMTMGNRYLKILGCLLALAGTAQGFVTGKPPTSLTKKLGTATSRLTTKTFLRKGPFDDFDSYPFTTSTALGVGNTSLPEEEEKYSFDPSNIPFGILWVAFLTFVYAVAPSNTGDFDQGLIQAILDNPAKPEINELFNFVFTQFVTVSSVIFCVGLPQASKKGPPAVPFFLAASVIGYIPLGLYMLTRGKPKSQVTREDLSWFTANGLESKVFAGALVLLVLYSAAQVPWANLDALLDGYEQLFQSSMLVAASTVDLTILTLVAATLIPQDYRLRNPDDADRANLIGAATLLVPILGSAMYCLWRPSLPSSEEAS